jgi:histidinol dehydrogenase
MESKPMRIYDRPNKAEINEIVKRPTFDVTELNAKVSAILDNVKVNGDNALRKYSRDFDKFELDDLQVTKDEFDAAESSVTSELKDAISLAVSTIEKFHCSQRENEQVIETASGVFCWRRSIPIEPVGIYVPAGTAPLFSTVLMLAVPAQIAGCREIILCSPPNSDGKINDAVLYAARICGVTRAFKVGGAQSIAAMAYGTESIPKVFKIFGPGNQYVTCAKQLVAQTGTAIDLPAGPSEIAILADDTCVPAFVAADLLSQAEHGVDSQCVLVTTSKKIADEVLVEIDRQLAVLPRKEIAGAALENSSLVVEPDFEEAIELINAYAPEHLILAVRDADVVAYQITNAGSVFLGNFSTESAGDYASGTNHTLPTNGYARNYSGVSLDSFVKKITYQKLTELGLRTIGGAIETMATAEGLDAHKNAVSIRLEAINAV